MRFLRSRLSLLVGLLLASASGFGVPVEIDVSGGGFLMDRRLENLIDEIILRDTDGGEAALHAYEVEDAVLILNGELNRRGFLEPEIEVTLWAGGKIVEQYPWDPEEPRSLPPLDEVTTFGIAIEKGVRSYFSEVRFEGLESITEDEGASYFFPDNALYVSKAERVFSDSTLSRGQGELSARLEQLGYPEALVTARQVNRDLETGETRVVVAVKEGPSYRWGSLAFQWGQGTGPVEGVTLPLWSFPEGPFNRSAQQDLAVALRNRFLEAGYPDVQIVSERSVEVLSANEVRVSLVYRVIPGNRVGLSEVTFEGLQATHEDFLRRQVALLEPGYWLNRLDVDRARSKIGRLGVFERVNVSLEPSDGAEERAVHFELQEGLKREVNLLFGYGSYEQVRVGAEVRFFNLLGRAHQGRIRLHQSFKSTAGSMTYSVPDLPTFLEQGQVRLQGLHREEISFTREEAIASIGVEHRVFRDAVRLTAQYSYQILRTVDFETSEEAGDEEARVGSITLGFAWDRRDRVVFPRQGHDLRAELELASPVLASEAQFQRFVVGGSWHATLAEESIRFHFGLEQGILARAGAEQSELPFNKRFFPGGENSIRGYREGEASPLGPDGETLGSETYTLGHAEVEFALTRSLGVVFFVDGLLQARYLKDYPGHDPLWSAGGGLRYDTPLGPVRLEYGYNLNPREGDPSGALHFSIGFPF